ncbi:MAG: preprotein translocase subunit SecE [Fibrella sp.]|nr:preprotein translocase subunit SecE [Armatimonadota bacterium]
MATATDTVKTEDSAQGFNIGRYLSEVQVELKKAEWPTRAELIRLTQVVLTLIFIVAVYCGGLDGLLGLVTNRLFNRNS